MRFVLSIALVILAVGDNVAQAENRQFPYQALVEVDGEYVRSGPGPSFYPTDKLRKGDKVTVHRHDPGGWFMITPPPGSFSWIKAEHVQRSGDSAGTLKSNSVVVHVGSSLSDDEFTTIQGNLSRGEAVQILGEKSFPFEDGAKLMYKISPVRREWRWIKGKSIVAADAIRSEPFPGQPVPRAKSGPVADQIELDPDAFTQPISTGGSVMGPDSSNLRPQKARPGISPTKETDAESSGFFDRLDLVDEQFREMIKQDPATWNLPEIQQQYTQLDNEATLPSQSKTIALRLDAVSRYEKTHREYVNFLNLREVARQRDAQLAAVQQQREAELQALSGTPSPGQPRPATPTMLQPQPNPGPTASTGNNAVSGDPIRPANPTSPTGPTPAPNQPRFAGAGMVVPMAQSFAGGPQFALVAPGGKLLAYLVPSAGVDLKRAVNQSMGIIGDRSFRKEWGADVIMVRGLQPVQLRASR